MESPGLSRARRALAPRFRVIREIGRGAASHVYVADDRKLERHVAIKILDEQLTRTLAAERFMREIQIAAGLSHPHVLPLYDSGEADGLLYYVMPFVDGESLRSKIAREGQLPLPTGLRVAGEVLDALSYAHAHGIIHRDVTPGNILLSDGHAWVADFGVARAVELAAPASVTETGQVIGTPSYMSPEQATGEGGLDGRTDLYSLACVMYEMFVGQPPYTGPSAQVVLARHVADTIPQVRAARPQIPEHVERALERAMAKSPSDRFQSAVEMAEGLGLEALAPGIGRIPKPSHASRRGIRTLLVAAALIASVATGYWLVREASESGTLAVSETDPTSLAVLPFEDLTPSSEYGWLSLGLTHELIDALSPVLEVRSYGASRPFAAGALSADSVGRLLHVATLVTGRLELYGDALQVTVNLTDAGTGRSLGMPIEIEAALDDQEAPDSLRIRMVEDVALALRENLGQHITLERWRREAGDAEAWALLTRSWARAERAERERVAGDIVEALELLLEADSMAVRAASADPDWIEPHVQRARLTYALSRVSNAARLRLQAGGRLRETRVAYGTPENWLDDGLRIIGRVLSDRPTHATALELRGRMLYRLSYYVDRNSATELRDRAEASLREAVRINQRQTGAWLGLSQLLGSKGAFREQAEAAGRAVETDAFLTLDEEGLDAQFWAALRDARFGDAQALCSTGRARFPNTDLFVDCQLAVIGFSGSDNEDASEAAAELERIEATGLAEPDTRAGRRMWLAFVLARSGHADSARRVVEGARSLLQEGDDRVGLLFSEARVAVLLGDEDTAFDILERYLEARPAMRPFVANHPYFMTLHDDPRFQEVLGRPSPGTS